MLNYRHVPFAVFRQQCGGVGEAGLKRYDIMNGEDGLAGLGVPAKAITIMNHGLGSCIIRSLRMAVTCRL